MNNIIKSAEKSPLVLVINILFTVMVFFQFVILFLGRWQDFISFGINIVFVVGSWMMYANAFNKYKTISFGGIQCIRAWAMCKVVLQGLVIIMFIISGIILIVGGVKYDIGVLIFSGIMLLLFGVAMRVFIMIFFIKTFNFIGKSIYQIKKNEQVFILAKYKIWLILMAAFEGVKMIVVPIAGVFIDEALGDWYYNWFDYFERGFLVDYLAWIGNSCNLGCSIIIFFTSGLTIAICVLGIFAVKKFVKIKK